MFEYFDIHSHLDFPDYDNDREQEIAKLKKENIDTITSVTNLESSQRALALANSHDNLFGCVGQHPGDLDNNSSFDDELRDLADNKKVVAIGECGLDYFRMSPDNLDL